MHISKIYAEGDKISVDYFSKEGKVQSNETKGFQDLEVNNDKSKYNGLMCNREEVEMEEKINRLNICMRACPHMCQNGKDLV